MFISQVTASDIYHHAMLLLCSVQFTLSPFRLCDHTQHYDIAGTPVPLDFAERLNGLIRKKERLLLLSPHKENRGESCLRHRNSASIGAGLFELALEHLTH